MESKVSRVASAASQVPGKLSSAAAAIQTNIANVLGKVNVGVDVGTRNVTIHLGDKVKQLWPAGHGLTKVAALPLPSVVKEAVGGIVDRLSKASYLEIDYVVGFLMALGFVPTGAALGLAFRVHSNSNSNQRHCAGKLPWMALSFAVLVPDWLACLLFWTLYRFLDDICHMGRALQQDLDIGPGVGKALLGFRMFVANGVLSSVLCFLPVLENLHARRT